MNWMEYLKQLGLWFLKVFFQFLLVAVVMLIALIIFGECSFALISWLLEMKYEGGAFVRWLAITLWTH